MIETLKGINFIGGFGVVVMDELKEKFPEKFNESGGMDYKWFEKEIRPKNFIYVRNDVNSIAFTIQNGPIKEVGVNGCQLDTVIEIAAKMLEGANTKFPCVQNEAALYCLNKALIHLSNRREEREVRGVEGLNKA